MNAVLGSLILAVPLFACPVQDDLPSVEEIAAMEAMQTGKASPLPTFEGTVYGGRTKYFLSSALRKLEEPALEKLVSRMKEVNVIPEQRLARFAYHNQFPAFWGGLGAVRWSKIVGWGGEVFDVVEGRDGWTITVRITPRVVDQWGGSTVIFDYYYETYRVTRDGRVTLIGIKEGTGGMRGGIG